MKNILLTLLILSLGAYAQASEHGKQCKHHNHDGQSMERMTQHLQLSSEQQTQVQAVLNEQKAEREELQAETDQKVRAILTPEQLKKYENMKKQHHGKMKEHHQGNDAKHDKK